MDNPLGCSFEESQKAAAEGAGACAAEADGMGAACGASGARRGPEGAWVP